MLFRHALGVFVFTTFLSPLSIGYGADIQTRLVEVNGTQLYYEIAGTGPAVVLLHPGNLDRRIWDEQFQLFAERYRVIRYDVRGHGKSAQPTRPYSDTEDLFQLLQLLQIKKASLVGLSLGGRISIDFIRTKWWDWCLSRPV